MWDEREIWEDGPEVETTCPVSKGEGKLQSEIRKREPKKVEVSERN